MRQSQTAPAPGTAQVGAVAMVVCAKCNTQNPATSKFCSSCGGKLGQTTVPCPKCKADVAEGAKFCPECGGPMAATKKCASCGVDVPESSKFCPECGKQA